MSQRRSTRAFLSVVTILKWHGVWAIVAIQWILMCFLIVQMRYMLEQRIWRPEAMPHSSVCDMVIWLTERSHCFLMIGIVLFLMWLICVLAAVREVHGKPSHLSRLLALCASVTLIALLAAALAMLNASIYWREFTSCGLTAEVQQDCSRSTACEGAARSWPGERLGCTDDRRSVLRPANGLWNERECPSTFSTVGPSEDGMQTHGDVYSGHTSN